MQFILHCRSHQVTCFHSVCSPVNFLKFSRLHTSLDKQPRTTNRRGCCSAHVFLGDVVQLQITSINYRSLHVKVTGNEKQNMCLVIGFKLVLFFGLVDIPLVQYHLYNLMKKAGLNRADKNIKDTRHFRKSWI